MQIEIRLQVGQDQAAVFRQVSLHVIAAIQPISCHFGGSG